MARYLALPCRSRYVGLDYLRLFLSGAIAKWRNLAAEAKTREVLAQANRKVADYAMAFDLLVRLSHITDEEATIAAIQELFAMLFGVHQMVYAQVEEGRVKEIFAAEERPRDRLDLQQALDALHEGYLIMPSGNGFFLRIDYQDTVLGLTLVREIPFPAYRDQYLNLGLAISNLCGLAISNARTFVKLRRPSRTCAASAISMPACSNRSAPAITITHRAAQPPSLFRALQRSSLPEPNAIPTRLR